MNKELTDNKFYRLSTDDLLEICFELANKNHDGHFTLMKFTSNWRASFGPQPNRKRDIKDMASGPHLRWCLVNLLQKEIDKNE